MKKKLRPLAVTVRRLREEVKEALDEAREGRKDGTLYQLDIADEALECARYALMIAASAEGELDPGASEVPG